MPKKKEPEDQVKPKELIEDIYPHHFWLEKYNDMNKRKVDICDKYVPHINAKPHVTPKFYSTAELTQIPSTKQPLYGKYLEMVNHSYRGEVKCRHSKLVLENHVYGSRPGSGIVHDRKDSERFFRPIRRADLSDFAEKVASQRVTERPAFSGTIFRLY